ncbi:MAG TPA: carboxypeptidase regulatory-like domain-containing protein [Pyrinomonadaceae bacterium]|nr:carboxypeptidase regulatory-like domain-containing protein [Pyrinomonadaceae bacterium]
MRNRLIFRTALGAFVLAALAVAAQAQVTTIEGRVTLKQADGTEVPVQGAVVDIYRTDVKWKAEVKTNKDGRYTHAGIPLSGTYTLAVSAPGARPDYMAGLRLSQQPRNDFALEAGDGARLTLEQTQLAARPAASAGGGAAASGPSKEEQAKIAAERARVEAENQKIANSNEVVSRTFKTGNAALQAGNFDAAIASYNEGLAAREEVALYANKSEALRQRGVQRFNAAIKLSDATAKQAAIDTAYQDWRDAADAASKAVALAKTQTAATDPAAAANQVQNRLAALSTRAEAMRLVATKVDRSQVDAAMTAFTEYMAESTDPAKKAKAGTDMARMLFDAGAYDRAVAEYRKIIEAEPDNADANLYLGFALFNTGDKAKFQEAANYISAFVAKAPDTNPTKAEAKAILDFLKENENIRPEKVTPARTTGRRRGNN